MQCGLKPFCPFTELIQSLQYSQNNLLSCAIENVQYYDMSPKSTTYVLAFAIGVIAVENGLARTPQMGWVCHPQCQAAAKLYMRLTHISPEQLEYLCLRCF